MNCSFCFTGEQGFKRNLTAAEMVGQYLGAWRWLEENPRILNLVFMGQGEPLHNFKAVKKACEIFLDQHGLSIGLQKITLSTAGYSPGLRQWLDHPIGVNLALSLHTARTLQNEVSWSLWIQNTLHHPYFKRRWRCCRLQAIEF